MQAPPGGASDESTYDYWQRLGKVGQRERERAVS